MVAVAFFVLGGSPRVSGALEIQIGLDSKDSLKVERKLEPRREKLQKVKTDGNRYRSASMDLGKSQRIVEELAVSEEDDEAVTRRRAFDRAEGERKRRLEIEKKKDKARL